MTRPARCGWEASRSTSSRSRASWSGEAPMARSERSSPVVAATRATMSASSPLAIAHRVWGTTRIRSTPSRCTPRMQPTRASWVTRPPGVRMILASPTRRPIISSGSMRESMQVTMATPAWAMPSKPPSENRSRYSALPSSRSSNSCATDVSVGPDCYERVFRLARAPASRPVFLLARRRPGRPSPFTDARLLVVRARPRLRHPITRSIPGARSSLGSWLRGCWSATLNSRPSPAWRARRRMATGRSSSCTVRRESARQAWSAR